MQLGPDRSVASEAAVGPVEQAAGGHVAVPLALGSELEAVLPPPASEAAALPAGVPLHWRE